MTYRLASLIVLAALLAAPAHAKDKKKVTLTEDILRATTVRVVIRPEAGEPLNQPMANSNARDNVEKALTEWGRLRVVMDGAQSDLVIAVRTGSERGVPSIKGGPIDSRTGVGQGTDSTIRIGAQQGRLPNNDPSMSQPPSGPQVSKGIGPTDDMFEVYRGKEPGTDPLDAPAVWRYVAKDCLRAPNVTAVDEFRKAIADAEKPQTSQKKP